MNGYVISTILFSFFLSLTFYLYFSLCLPFTLFLKQYNIEFIYCTYIDDIFLEKKNSFKRIRELSFLLFCFLLFFFFFLIFYFFFFLFTYTYYYVVDILSGFYTSNC